jgi:glycosyltransferase involved in cell wall biosynthesis
LHNFPLLDDFNSRERTDGTAAIHVGEQTKIRGCSVLVEAARLMATRVPEAKLLLVGRFDDQEYRDEIDQLIFDHGLERSVVLTGEVPYGEIPRWLSQADIGLIALQEAENFKTAIPTKLFEYMASGIPVVSSDLPPTRQFTDGLNCSILVEPADPREYAEAIEYLLTHPIEAQCMGKNGRRAVERKYNWGTEAEKLVGLYQRLE